MKVFEIMGDGYITSKEALKIFEERVMQIKLKSYEEGATV